MSPLPIDETPNPHTPALDSALTYLRDIEHSGLWSEKGGEKGVRVWVMDKSKEGGRDSRFDTTTTLNRYTPTSTLIHWSQKGSMVLSTRDYLVATSLRYDAVTNTTYYFSTSVEDTAGPVPGGKRVRAWMKVSGWILRDVEGGVDVTYVEDVDIKGRVPSAFVKMFATQNPLFPAHIGIYISTHGTPPFLMSSPPFTPAPLVPKHITVVSETFDTKTKKYSLEVEAKSKRLTTFSIAVHKRSFPGSTVTLPQGTTVELVPRSVVGAFVTRET
ncbi:hypothetical protein HK104_007723, partial [Borealophlyctis nickersoniae]